MSEDREEDWSPFKRTEQVGEFLVEEIEINGKLVVFVNNTQQFGADFDQVVKKLDKTLAP